MSSVPDIRQAHLVPIAMQPTIKVQVDLAAAQRYGLRPGDVRREATTLASGLTVGNLYEQAKVFDVVVLGGPTTRHDLTGLEGIKIDTPSGEQVRLGDVAKVSVGTEPASIVHNEVMRSVDVVADITGRNAGAVVANVQAAVSSVPMPAEAHLQVFSPAADQQSDPAPVRHRVARRAHRDRPHPAGGHWPLAARGRTHPACPARCGGRGARLPQSQVG